MKQRTNRYKITLFSLAVLFFVFMPHTIEASEETGAQKTTFPVQVIQKTGDDNENFVILIMGDGYTADQQDQFLADAARKAQGMLTWSPYKEYSDHINIYAMQVVSNEQGIGVYGGKEPDTYFHVTVIGKAPQFFNGGTDKARALRSEMEEKYLDAGANVGTIHILSNADGSYGASQNSLFSFSTNGDDNVNGTAMTHEISHSIGRLADEYGRYTNQANTSDTSDPDAVKWNKLLGFRGTGITMAGTETAFAPSRECMMRWLGQPFCEVCKMELARKLNNPDYVSRPAALYVADPEISIPHSSTGTLDRDSEKYRISEKNITKANGKDLEFRSVVQNLVDQEQHLRMSFRILGADGTTVKYETEKEFTIPALSNSYDPDVARASLSVVLSDVYGLSDGDRLDGKIIDMDTNEVLATDKTAEQAWSTIRIHYQMRNEDGTESDVPHTMTSTVYVPDGSMYTLRKPALSGYTCVGSSVSEDQVRVTGEGIDLTYYYQKNVAPPENTDQKIAECSTRPVRVTYDAKPHTFDITPGDGVTMHYSMTEDGAYSLQKLPFYTDAGNYTVYYEASAASAKPSYGQAELEIIKADTGLQLTAATQKTEGGKTVTLQLKRQGLPASEPVGISCNDAAIRIDKTQNDKWSVTFPNVTKTYTFTAQYDGNNNYTGSKASCQIAVTEKVAETSEVTPVVKPEEKPEEKPETKPVKKPVKKISEIVINAKPKVKKDTARIENADVSIKKQVNKIGKQAKNVSVKIRYNTKKKKNLILKLDRSTIKLLVKKEVKELQLDNGNVRATLDLKTLKELNKRVNADIYLQIKKADKRKLSAKTKKRIGKRPVYEVSITTTRAKTKQLSKVKTGKITIETRCTCSKTKRKNHMSSYAIDKKGNIIKKQKTSYDTKKKVIRYTTSQHSQRVTGE